jgi:hypothetical protein
MFRVAVLLVSALSLLAGSAFAQDRVAPEMMYHRVWAIVPLIGKGTSDDPKRPMFTPSPADAKAAADQDKADFAKTGKKKDPAPPVILSYSMQLSDDGNSALVEFVGLNPQALAFITQSKAPGVKAFERGKATKQEIETEFKKVKASFTLDSLQGRGQQQ